MINQYKYRSIAMTLQINNGSCVMIFYMPHIDIKTLKYGLRIIKTILKHIKCA